MELTLRHRVFTSILACMLAFAVTDSAAAERRTSSRLRGADERASVLIAEGIKRSPALRTLVDRLERYNVIVYVEYAVLPSNFGGRLTVANSAGGWRYVRVQIDCRQTRVNQIVALGHEMRHAIEIAGARAADERSMRALYQAIGFATDAGERQFESNAAQQTGLEVRRDLLWPAGTVKQPKHD